MQFRQGANLLEAERGHRRGVVLGLTLAEIMLLMLFCLLLVAASLLEERERQLKEERQRADVAELTLREANIAVPKPGAIPLPDIKQLESKIGTLEAALAAQGEELRRLQELDEKLREAVPGIAALPAAAPIPDDTWRELVLAREAGEAVLESGATLAEIESALESAASANEPEPLSPGENDWPPIITLGSDEFRFVRNSAELSEDFRGRLETDIAEQLVAILQEYDVDVIEVVGHTDELAIDSERKSTLDLMAIGAMSGTVPVGELIPADNAGLGLARAISVANTLIGALNDPSVKVVPLSAAQLVMPGDELSDGLNPLDDANRRRIEIRVRRSDDGGNVH